MSQREVLETKPMFRTFEEREAAYLAARRRIFATYEGDVREPVNVEPKPRSVPVVARRMIAHALGQRVSPWNQDVAGRDCHRCAVEGDELNVKDRGRMDSPSGLKASQFQVHVSLPGKSIKPFHKRKSNNHKYGSTSPSDERKLPKELAEKGSTNISTSHKGTMANGARKEYSREEHLGATKRMFARALGLHSERGGFLTKCGGET